MSQRTSWSLKEYLDYLKRSGRQQPSDPSLAPSLRAGDKNPVAGRAAPKKRPSKTQAEAEYELILQTRYPEARILFEAYTLKLAFDTRYTPDLAVVYPDGRIDFYEIKGKFLFEKALNKPKIAARLFPQHNFFLAQKTRDGWVERHLRSD